MITGELILLIGLALLFFVLVVVIFWYFWSNQKVEDTTEQIITHPPKREVDTNHPSQLQPTNQEIALLQRNQKTGRLVIEINKIQYEEPNLISENKRLELQKVAKELFLWLNEKQAATAVPGPATTTENKIDLRSASLNQAANAEIEGDRLNAGSMVEQVDAIVQKLIANSPTSYPPVKIVEDARRGVVVWVGLKSYEGVNSVPDADISALLHKAVAEWEQRKGRLR